MDVYENIGDISDTVRKDIDRGIGILKAGGCEAVFLFGSVVEGRSNSRSDIDFAVRGCPAGMFYRLQGKLLLELSRSADLVDLDADPETASFLQRKAELIRID